MNLKEPLFSVVIPLYNKEAHISDTLHSVLSQTFERFEVIVVNDGSTDQSLNIVQAFTDNRLRVYTKKNGGVSEARNYGISNAQGDYIALLDADDRWEVNFLEEMKSLIEKYPLCGLYASAFKKIKKHKTVTFGDSIPEGILENFFEVKMHHFIPCSSAVIIQKKVFDDVGGFPVGMIGGEDDYTWAKIAVKHKVAFTPKILAIYNGLSTSYSFRIGKMDSCQESWFDFYKKGDFYRNEFLAKKALYAGIRYAYNPNQNKSNEIEKLTRFTVLSKKLWWDLYLLNRIPYNLIVLLKIVMPHYMMAKYWLSKVKRNTSNFFMHL